MSLFRKKKIGRGSIKESLDDLPSGVCFAKPNGIIVLMNRKMDELAREIMGRDLQQLSELQEALLNPKEAVKIVSAEHSMYLFPNGKVWQFTESKIICKKGEEYILTATVDVTELYNKEKQLQAENAELEEINARAVALYAEIDQIVRDEENFAMKTKIHDELGMALLKSRQILTEKSNLEEMRLMGEKWAYIGETLGIVKAEVNKNSAFSPDIEIDELKEMTKGIGISLHIDGELPNCEKTVKVLFSAIRECATNAVRHAEADKISVKIYDIGNKIKAEITNNGNQPKSEITEGGGLSSLRRRIESAYGIMNVQYKPVFKLTVFLAKEETV